MMHNPPRNLASDNQRNMAYLGKIIRTTGDRYGVVRGARNNGTLVDLKVVDDDGIWFDTDSEHATIVRMEDDEDD